MSTLPRPAQHMVLLGMGSLTMGGVSKFFCKYERYQSETVDGGQAASAPTMAQ